MPPSRRRAPSRDEDALGVRSRYRQCVQIAVVTPQHFITGDVELHEQRLSDFLGNILASTLKLSGTAIARLTLPTEVLARHAEAHIPTSEIIAAFEQGDPAAPHPGAIVRKHPHSVFLISGPIEVQGRIHSLGAHHFDIREMLTTLADRFVPVTQAEVRLVATDHRLSLPAVMLNVRRVTYMARSGGAT